MSESSEVAKLIYDEMNTVMEAAMKKVAERFSADDWDALTSPDREDCCEPEKDNR